MKTKIKSKRSTVKYMHTINGYPARFLGDQIYYAYYKKPTALADSLKQIKKEQIASKKFRRGKGWSDCEWQYGYFQIEV